MSDALQTQNGSKFDVEALLKAAQAGSVTALAKLLTALERLGPAALQFRELLKPASTAFRVGITGPPGAGKSTLINELLAKLTPHFKKIAVLAIDPTSPISNGAILGDRIRYSENIASSGVFVRSLGTRGSLGGLSASAYVLLRAFDACGFDFVLIETVGVGQAEVEVMHVADQVAVVLVPESGDSIQAMKAGIIEIADVFVVNKSDRPGAESLKREIEASVTLTDESKKVDVFLVSAIQGQGVGEFTESLLKAERNKAWQKNRALPKRLREEAKALMRARLEQKAEARVAKIEKLEDLRDVLMTEN